MPLKTVIGAGVLKAVAVVTATEFSLPDQPRMLRKHLQITVTVVADAVLVEVVVTKSAVLVSVMVIVGTSNDASAIGRTYNL